METEKQRNMMKKRRKRLGINKADQLQLLILALPALITVIVMNYIPMFGVVIAFKNYRYDLGILGSEWVGLKNFEFFFKSNDAALVIRNSLLYNILFIITGQFLSIVFAIMLTNVKKKKFVGVYQNAMFQPFFLSWVVVAYVSLVFLSYKNGILNSFVKAFGIEPISWYNEQKYWPFILWFFQMWKGLGYQVLIYYTTIIGLDESIYEAARVDGCSLFKMTYKITLPMITPTVTILVIMSIGKIFNSDFGLFYQIPQNSGALKNVTDVVETYTYRTLTVGGNAGVAGAVGFTQSIVGLILVLITNAVVKHYNEENALF